MSAFVLPPALRPGDLVSVVAPSSPVPAAELLRGLAWIRERYRVRATESIFGRRGYLAGTDAERAAELERALTDPESKAILVARGGYGAMRILPDVDLTSLSRRPKWIVGFSDVTTLHAEAWALGVASVHGPHVGTLGDASASDREAWLASLERPDSPREWSGLTVVHAGEATGPIVGGNLTLLVSMAASGRLVLPQRAVLAIEDTNERPYRVDRMLTALTLGGHLRGVAGVVVGSFDRCEPGPDAVTVEEVIAERTAGLGIPVLAGAPFGHAGVNRAFVMGSMATMSGSTVALCGGMATAT
jgi:muramoyltetrapeptide carboxypeptidase